jgi:cytochrome c oxidase subunit II
MAKVLAVTIIIIAIASAIPIITHQWDLQPDISKDGILIDRQFDETMWEAGLSFLAAQFVLAAFIWKYSNRSAEARIGRFPGGAGGLVAAAFLLVGTEVLALGIFGTKAWAQEYLTPASSDAMPIEVQAQQFAFYFRYPGPDGKFGATRPQLISAATENFLGLDPNDPAGRDDIVTAEMAVPVNREIRLWLHSIDMDHAFFVQGLRVHQDVVPGLDLYIHFTAVKPGKYEIVCTQLCGLGHYNMKAYLYVFSQQDFDAWLKKEAALQ